MANQRDSLKDTKDYYDVVVIGSGLGGLTGANCLAKQGHSVLLLEHHYQFGGLATWFKRAGGHIFDISLHGFPVGMIKSCRRYWTKEIADSIVQLKNIRFVNPQYDFAPLSTDLISPRSCRIHLKSRKIRLKTFMITSERWTTLKKMVGRLEIYLKSFFLVVTMSSVCF